MSESIDRQWELFQEKRTIDIGKKGSNVTDQQLMEAVKKDLIVVCKMSVKEYTLYQKWLEIKNKYTTHRINTLFGLEDQLVNMEQDSLIKEIRSNLWYPENVDDYLNIQPVLINTNKDTNLSKKWNVIRTFSSTMKNNSNIGRNLNFIVQDKVSNKYLGVICVSSDFLDLTPRDNWIGWCKKKKVYNNMINNTAICSTVVPVQPFGFNYVGGKLLALLCLSDTVQKLWKKVYNDVLVGITTTSLYGSTKINSLSQYDNLKYWKKMGYTSGTLLSYETTKSTQCMIRDWLYYYHPLKYFEWYVAKRPITNQPLRRDHRNRSYNFAYRNLGIDKNMIRNTHKRGIYFSSLYKNTREFLCNEIDDNQLVKAFDTTESHLVDLWKHKYANKRVENLVKNDRVMNELLFYDDAIHMSWDETRSKYLPQVGR